MIDMDKIDNVMVMLGFEEKYNYDLPTSAIMNFDILCRRGYCSANNLTMGNFHSRVLEGIENYFKKNFTDNFNVRLVDYTVEEEEVLGVLLIKVKDIEWEQI